MQTPSYREELSSQIPALQLLMHLGYTYIPPDRALDLREGRLDRVVLEPILEDWLASNNRFQYKGETYPFNETAIQNAVRRLTTEPFDGLVRTNEKIYEMLAGGIALPQTIQGDTRSFTMNFINWQDPSQNVYHVTDEYVIERRTSHQTCRPDIVCFVNGIPFVVIECKRPDLAKQGGGMPYEEAVSQMIRNQGDEYIPQLFIYTQLLMALSRNHSRFATTGTPAKFWTLWKEEDLETHEARTHALINAPLSDAQKADLYDWREFSASIRKNFDSKQDRLPTEQDRAIVSLLDPARLLELTQLFLVYDGGDKKIARYQQYYAVKHTLDRVVSLNPQGERTGGVIWHTTGSGKSLSMVMLAKALALHPSVKNPRVLLVTDRINLDEQIYGTFQSCGKQIVQAKSGKHLIQLVESEGVDIIATVINKFETVAAEKVTNDNPNVFALVDESHRGQYGRIHAMMRRVFRKACYIGFTGTPLTKLEKNTAAKFGNFIHKYSMRQAVEDQAVAPLLYEGRHVELEVDKQQVDRWFERVTRDLSDEQKADLKLKMSRAEEISHVDQRVAEIAFDLSQHFEANFKGTGFKAQLATSSKAMALKYKRYLDEWGMVKSEVVISPPDTREGHEEIDESTPPEVQAFWKRMMNRFKTEKAYNREIIADFARADGVELLIVVDKLLVGFDEPRNTVLYIDKSLKEHAILQAIARVNRLFEGKDFGYVIDYRGILGELNEAMQIYDALADFDLEDVANTVMDVTSEIEKLPQLHSDLWALFNGVNREDSEAMERFLEPEDKRQEFYDRLTAYVRSLKVALSTNAFYEKVSEKRIALYKRDMKFFHNLRMAIKLRYAEVVDYRDYEDKIRKLLSEHIDAEGVTPVVEATEIFNREKFDEALGELNTPIARAEAILHRLKRTVLEKMDLDPAFYKKFSELIDEAIAAAREGRMKQLDLLAHAEDLQEQIEQGKDMGLPEKVLRYKHAPAYYGVIRETMGNYSVEDAGVVDLAIEVEESLQKLMIRDWHKNPDVMKRMMAEIDDLLYELQDAQGVEITSADKDVIIEGLVDVARKRT